MGKFRRKDPAKQDEFWIRPQEIVIVPHNALYEKLGVVLNKIDFTSTVHRLCTEHYARPRHQCWRPPAGGPCRPRAHALVGFLKGIGIERGIASRCADSLAIRRFLGYSLTEETPDYSTFADFRQRLPKDVLVAIHTEVLRALKAYGPFKGRKLGIDSYIIEANASLSGLEHRNTEQSYHGYVRERARAAGVDAGDPAAAARFDRKREGGSRVLDLCVDKGYHDSTELAIIQHATGLRTVIGDACAGRRNLDIMEPEERTAVKKAARAVKSRSGKALPRARGEKIERGFAHVLHDGGLRRTHLRGRENINKRYLCGIIAFGMAPMN